ncbi:hypothetical protein F1643_09685, partial [Azospirillum sp. INR13]|uniref:hypothetical protein n=1 Tax=Azospirillum sp. INR13 TaxID=2596919 RepID=UPI0018923170
MTIVTFGPYSFDTDALRGRGFLTPYVINGVTYELETAMRVAASLDIAAKAAEAAEASLATAADRQATAADRVVTAADRQAAQQAAQQAAASAETWDPTNYIKRDGSTDINGPLKSAVANNSAFRSSWIEVGATQGGLGYVSSNLYNDGNTWR